MHFLLFQIYAPLVSWGDIAVGGERLSSRHPSKSAIVGLIAAALGIRRDDEIRLTSLAEAIGFAVQLHSAGSVLHDFHTVQVPRQENKVAYHTRQAELAATEDKIGTILSRREYRCDALAVAAVYLKKDDSEWTLEQIASMLQNPVFQLYFGRKSCVPGLPMSPKIIQSDTLANAFGSYSKPEWLKQVHVKYAEKTLFDKQTSFFWEDGTPSGFECEDLSVERYDYPASRKRWQFKARREYMKQQPSVGGENVL